MRIARSLWELEFGKLMEVYADSTKGSLLAEQDFYQYLSQCFFTRSGDCYCLWEAEEQYKAALRLQRYRDGLLLEALETAPQCRRQGFGKTLVLAALAQFPQERFYVHIDKKNAASRKLHEGCGFRKIADTATLADGSVTSRASTYVLR